MQPRVLEIQGWTPPPEEETDPGVKLFYCEPYECKMLVRSCIKRQEVLIDASKRKIRRGMGYVSYATMQQKFDKCVNCQLGAQNMTLMGLETQQVRRTDQVPSDPALDLDVGDFEHLGAG